MVSIKDVHKSFGELEVLKGVSMDIMKGECICIIGPSGSGKSTLIRCVNALNDIQQGSILVEGQEVNDPKLDKLELRKKVGMAGQATASDRRNANAMNTLPSIVRSVSVS